MKYNNIASQYFTWERAM